MRWLIASVAFAVSLGGAVACSSGSSSHHPTDAGQAGADGQVEAASDAPVGSDAPVPDAGEAGPEAAPPEAGSDAAVPDASDAATPDASDAAVPTTRLCSGYQLLSPGGFQITAMPATGGSCTFATPFAGTIDCKVDAATNPGNSARVAITVPGSSDFCVEFDMAYVGSPDLSSAVILYGAYGLYTQNGTYQDIQAVDMNGLRNYGDDFSQTYTTPSLQDPISGDARIKKDSQGLTAPQVRMYLKGSNVVALEYGDYSSLGSPGSTLTGMQVELGPEQYFLASSGAAVELQFTNVKVYKK